MRLIDAMAIYSDDEDAVYLLHNAALALSFGHDQYYYAARDDAAASGAILTSTFPERCLAWLRQVAPDALFSDAWETVG